MPNVRDHMAILRRNELLLLLGLYLASGLLGIAISKVGLMIGVLALGGPIGLMVAGYFISNPRAAAYFVLVWGFIVGGIGRYVPGPQYGLIVDGVLFLGILGWIAKQTYEHDFSGVNNDAVKSSALWYGLIVLEIINPEAQSFVAWFYAMRTVGFYQLMTFVLVTTYLRSYKDVDRVMNIILWFSLAAAFWGMRQRFIGLDPWEDRWLYGTEAHVTHVLFGVLRTFSFYSDAGQYGASMAMIFTMAGILFVGPCTFPKRIFYLVVCISCLVGFGISGTRGALAVPGAGVIIYLIATRNLKILIPGAILFFTVFFVLKYTFMFQNVQAVGRMRSAMDPNDPSLMERLKNQRTFARYLKSRPLGGGVGSAGFWGERFSPWTLLAQTPTDSWYVKTWAETGIVGISLHLGILFFYMGKGFGIIWTLRDKELRQKVMAMHAGLGGILLASYGNQVFGVAPTGTILNVLIAMMIMSPHYDRQLEAMRQERRREADRLEAEKRKMSIQ